MSIQPSEKVHTEAEFTAKPVTCREAVVSITMGLLSLLFVTWIICCILAIVYGNKALNKIDRSNGQLKGTGLAIAGIVIPIALPILMVVLLPILNHRRNDVRLAPENSEIQYVIESDSEKTD